MSSWTVDRCRGGIEAWQIWNEPNHAWFVQPRPDPAGYTAMLRASYLTIKAADPAGMVVTGATAPTDTTDIGSEFAPEDWMRRLYLNGGRGYFDAVGHHPYSFPGNPLDPTPTNGFTRTMSIYGVMVEFGDAAKKIWATEMGSPTGTHFWAMSEADQAQWVHDYLLGWNTNFAGFTGPITMKSLRDLSPDAGDLWANTGVLRWDWSRKPSYDVFRWIMAAGLQ